MQTKLQNCIKFCAGNLIRITFPLPTLFIETIKPFTRNFTQTFYPDSDLKDNIIKNTHMVAKT